jgi:hypothetical protein
MPQPVAEELIAQLESAVSKLRSVRTRTVRPYSVMHAQRTQVAASLVWSMIMQDGRFLPYFHALRNYLLLGRGELCQAFLDRILPALAFADLSRVSSGRLVRPRGFAARSCFDPHVAQT